MRLADDFRQKLVTAEQQLIADGMPSYLDAMLALHEFRHTVVERCRTVLHTHRKTLTDAMGLRVSQDPIQDYIDPDSLRSWDGIWAWLGVKIRLQNVGTVYCGLCMEREGEHGLSIWASITLGLDTRVLFDTVWEMLKEQEPACGNDSRHWEVDTHGLTPVALAKEVCIYLEGCMPSNSL